MFKILLSLILASQFFVADFSWVAKEGKNKEGNPTTTVFVSFPTDVENLKVCIKMYDAYEEAGVHCWAPKGAIDEDVWEGWSSKGYFIEATLTQRFPDGSVRVRYAYPLPDEKD